ncbi:endonuclease/exonuclease/phosphatase family protein [Amycolatopsis japonica]|uniref:endonuclease/exonuclease/phosphatase family protein n=1 Tax=Amycolatopsis japonica TaxID=208439 RepID=UPI00366E1B28
MATVTVASWNLLDYKMPRYRDTDGEKRNRRIAEVIRGLGADVVLVQELVSPGSGTALLHGLAKDTGMDCYAELPWISEDDAFAGTVAAADARTGYHTGALWKPGFASVPGTFATFGAEIGLWHSTATITLTSEETGPFVVMPFHLDPFDPSRRMTEAQQLVRIAARHEKLPVIGGGDNNCEAANEITDPDPYRGRPWFPKMIHQVIVTTYSPEGVPLEWEADRRPARILAAGGLVDVAAHRHTGPGPLPPTAGHHPDDPFPHRRIDRILANPAAATRVIDCRTHPSDEAKELSDHIPVSVTIDLSPSRS